MIARTTLECDNPKCDTVEDFDGEVDNLDDGFNDTLAESGWFFVYQALIDEKIYCCANCMFEDLGLVVT